MSSPVLEARVVPWDGNDQWGVALRYADETRNTTYAVGSRSDAQAEARRKALNLETRLASDGRLDIWSRRFSGDTQHLEGSVNNWRAMNSNTNDEAAN
jgi:hypothetical protein